MIDSNDFFKTLVDQKLVRETYLNYQAAAELCGEVADKFPFGGIMFERYRTGAKATAANSNTAFIAANEGRVVVTGVPNLFIERYAPADYTETVNTMGVPRYAFQYESENRKSRKLEMQSNPIMVCTQPLTLRRLVMS